MKIILSKSQVDTIQECLVRDYIDGRLSDEQNKGSIEPSWYRKLVHLGKKLEAQTGVESKVAAEHAIRKMRI